MDLQVLIGDWDLAGTGREFIIEPAPEGPVLKFPEAPPGFEAKLLAAGSDTFRLAGGPYPEAEIRIEGPDRLLVGGLLPATRLSRPARAPEGGGLVAPPLDLDEDELTGCERIWAFVDHPSRHLDLDLSPLAPHRFVQWVTANELAIFHGSNRSQIEELTPTRRSMELSDPSGRGNRAAVYGTHDGLWAMFFAVIDRQRLRGSIRSGVDTHWSATGDRLDLYHFSVPDDQLSDRPFTSGTLYLLPRDRFVRLPYYPGGPLSQEWACEGPVRPLCRIEVGPDDFPFLDRLGGHDDGDVIAFNEQVDRVYGEVTSAREITDGIELITDCDREAAVRMVEMSHRFLPDVGFTITDHPDGIRVVVTGPEGYRQVLRTRFGDLLAP